MATSPSPFVQGQNLPSDPYSAYKYHNNQRALQAALVQSTNQGLLNIRNAELNYYAAFYLTFGGQATLIGGFLYTGINQIHFPDNIQYTDDVYHYLQLAFWLSSSICLGACMHCILVSIFVQVLGPGLGLHGPIGSMARAATGMRKEVLSTFYAYVIMMIALGVSVIASFWVLMEFKTSCICTGVFLVGMLQWWRYCLRIYNRFFVAPIIEVTDMDFDSSDSQSHHSRAASFDRRNSRVSSTGYGRAYSGVKDSDLKQADDFSRQSRTVSKTRNDSISSKKSGMGSFIDTIFARSKSMTSATADRNSHQSSRPSAGGRQQSEDPGLSIYSRYGRKDKAGWRNYSVDDSQLRDSDTATISNASDLSRPLLGSTGGGGGRGDRDEDEFARNMCWDPEMIACEGYLTKKGGISRFGDSWKSRYFVLRHGGQLYYYRHRSDFVANPNSAIKDRPILLSLYKVKGVRNINDKGFPTFLIQLLPRSEIEGGRIWEFRCDFEDDFEKWLQVLKKC